jgi:hypothetical protein
VVHYRLLPRVREWRNSFVKGGQPDKPAFELRQWSELWRSRPEAKFQVAQARHESGKGSDAEVAGNAEAALDQWFFGQ